MAQDATISGTSATSAAAAQSDRARLHKAAQDFEAMFLRQILSTARNADLGGDALFGDKHDDTFTQMRDARFADIAARSGSLGLAERLEAQLSARLATGAFTTAKER